MNDRSWASANILAIVVAAVFLASAFVAAQAPSPAAPKATAKPKTWVLPRTPDGEPDLQGIWSTSTITPLERPRELGNKEFFTPQEAAEFEKKMSQQNNADNRNQDANVDVALAVNNLWFDRGNKVVPTLRTSLIIDPPDGRIPPLTPEGQRKAQARADARRAHGPADTYEDFNLAEQCVARGVPRIPGAYNNNAQIFQSPGFVSIYYEMIHESRIIPVDARPHVDGKIRQYLGNSVGHWEGDTLVVDTTNYNDKIMFNINDCCGGAGQNLHIVERFRRIDANNIDYRFTVDDPTTFTKPWTVALPMTQTEGPIYEYDCHEGNYALMHMLSTARALEKSAAQAEPH